MKEDVATKKLNFENEYIENLMNKFFKTASWAMNNRKATEKDIGDYILTCTSEISMTYSSKPVIDFSIGDIVDVNYGVHIPGEIMGGHVHAIVCNIINYNMVFVVPIVKMRKSISSFSYLLMEAPKDAIYSIENCHEGIVVLDKGKYVRAERFNYVIGKTKPTFLKKLLKQLATTFDFTTWYLETDQEEEKMELKNLTNSNERDEASVKLRPNTRKKRGKVEAALVENIGFALDNLDKSKNVEEQIESFLTEIGMTTNEEIVTQSFIVACDIKKINFENVIMRLYEKFPKLKEEYIERVLKETFKDWLKKYPNLVEKCPKVSFTNLLKVFVKRFK